MFERDRFHFQFTRKGLNFGSESGIEYAFREAQIALRFGLKFGCRLNGIIVMGHVNHPVV